VTSVTYSPKLFNRLLFTRLLQNLYKLDNQNLYKLDRLVTTDLGLGGGTIRAGASSTKAARARRVSFMDSPSCDEEFPTGGANSGGSTTGDCGNTTGAGASRWKSKILTQLLTQQYC
jgi:hypothetical protein